MRAWANLLNAVILLAVVSCSMDDRNLARPSTIEMAGVDPCGLFTPDQLKQLDVQVGMGDAEGPSAANNNSPSCLWSSPSDVLHRKSNAGVFAQTVTYLGVDEVSKRASQDKSWIAIQGFRALLLDNPEGPDDPAYQVWVDVDDGQSLNIAYLIHDWKGAEQAGKDQARDKATQAANFAITTLLAR